MFLKMIEVQNKLKETILDDKIEILFLRKKNKKHLFTRG